VYALCSGSERKERSVHSFLNCLMQGTKTVMTRVELGGPLFLVAVIGGSRLPEKKGAHRHRRRHAHRNATFRRILRTRGYQTGPWLIHSTA
jgi:hypothetical protein